VPFAEGETLFSDWIARWMHEYKINSISHTTFESYRLAIDNHIAPVLGALKLNQITPDHIQNFLNTRMQEGGAKSVKQKSRKLSSAYTIKMKNIINASLKQAVKNRMIPYNPTDAVTPPKLVQKEIRVFTPEEQSRFMAATKGHRLEALFALALASGMRKGELLGLTWDCIDFDRNTIAVKRSVTRVIDPLTHESAVRAGETKTKTSKRLIPMLPAVIPILLAHKKRQEVECHAAGSAFNHQNIVFCSMVGTYIEPRRVNTTLIKLLDKAGIEHVSFHAFRHTFATRALENGIPAKVVAEIIGHADVALTLNTYTHVIGSTAHEQISKLNSMFSDVKNENMKEEPVRER
jgi:integrase